MSKSALKGSTPQTRDCKRYFMTLWAGVKNSGLGLLEFVLLKGFPNVYALSILTG